MAEPEQADDVELVTQAQYARMRNVSRQYISKKVSEGALPVYGGMIDPGEADFILGPPGGSRTRVNSGEGQNPNLAEYHIYRTRREKYHAIREGIKAQKDQEMVLDKDEVEEAVRAAGETLKAELKSRNRRLASKLAKLKTQQQIIRELDKSDTEILTHFTDKLPGNI